LRPAVHARASNAESLDNFRDALAVLKQADPYGGLPTSIFALGLGTDNALTLALQHHLTLELVAVNADVGTLSLKAASGHIEA
jgi:hypothetical protein